MSEQRQRRKTHATRKAGELRKEQAKRIDGHGAKRAKIAKLKSQMKTNREGITSSGATLKGPREDAL